jgi:hypothetical protein
MSLVRRGLPLVVAGCVALGAPSVASASGRPSITGFTATSTSLPAQGGKFDLIARVRHASFCVVDGLTHSTRVTCSTGLVTIAVTFGENPNATATTTKLSLRATNAYGSVTSRAISIVQAGTPAKPAPANITPASTPTPAPTLAPPPVVGLDTCTAGPTCDYGPIYGTYNNYGNLAPDGLGDCTFAAAANWEQIVLGATPDPTVIGYEFAQAGGTANGLLQTSFWSYWENSGIGGYYLTGLHSYYTDETDVENGVRDYGAMIVEFRFINGDYFGENLVSAGLHDAVVDGFTPEGPLVVSWGQTIQMSWQQWSILVVGMWGLAASTTPAPF